MKTADERILYLFQLLKTQKQVGTLNEFCEKIGTLRQTVHKIRKGEASFTVAQIKKICKIFNVNANWIFDIETNVFLTENSIRIS